MLYKTPSTYHLIYYKVSFKASHNSYGRDEQPLTKQLIWDKNKKYNGGCRGIEIDIHQPDHLWIWSVNHLGGYQGNVDGQFGEYLRLLNNWSDRNEDHDVITVTIDLKTDREDPKDRKLFPMQLDDYIARYFDETKLYKPGDLQGEEQDLITGAKKNGWPSLGDLKEKFLFCLSGKEKLKKEYAKTNKQRLCFADKKIKDDKNKKPDINKGNRVFLNLNLGSWEDFEYLKWFSKQDIFVTRGYGVNDRELWGEALKDKVNMIATDKVRKYPWASVGDAPFREH